MKKLAFLLLILLVAASCSPYQKINKPVTMKYSVGVYNNGIFEGNILCRDLIYSGDTLTLKDAGYFARQMKQRRVSEIRFIGKRDVIVIEMKPYGQKRVTDIVSGL